MKHKRRAPKRSDICIINRMTKPFILMFDGYCIPDQKDGNFANRNERYEFIELNGQVVSKRDLMCVFESGDLNNLKECFYKDSKFVPPQRNHLRRWIIPEKAFAHLFHQKSECVFLMINGYKVHGVIDTIRDYELILQVKDKKGKNRRVMLYKHALVSVRKLGHQRYIRQEPIDWKRRTQIYEQAVARDLQRQQTQQQQQHASAM